MERRIRVPPLRIFYNQQAMLPRVVVPKPSTWLVPNGETLWPTTSMEGRQIFCPWRTLRATWPCQRYPKGGKIMMVMVMWELKEKSIYVSKLTQKPKFSVGPQELSLISMEVRKDTNAGCTSLAASWGYQWPMLMDWIIARGALSQLAPLSLARWGGWWCKVWTLL